MIGRVRGTSPSRNTTGSSSAKTGEGLTLKLYADGRLYRWKNGQPQPEVVEFTEDTVIRGIVTKRIGDVSLPPAALVGL